MRKINQIIILLGIWLCNYYQASAQLNGYGAGVYVTSNFIHNTGILYTDDIRAKGINYVQYSGTTADIDLTNLHGSISVGNKLLIIQMKGVGIGIHEAVTVTNISGSTYSLQTVSGQGIYSFNTSGSGNMVQVILLNEYYDFTLSGGIVTCHNWDVTDGTGGVLALMVSHTLTINQGIITVAGKGFTADEAGITWGVGSTGGAANSTINLNNGLKPPPSTACLNGYGNVTVNQGDKGGVPGSSASFGTSNTGTPIYYGGSNKPTNLVMGDPGYYKAGSVAANGGQGGGWGGKGANSSAICIPNAGSNGLQGSAGWNGGNAGKGGNGGGAMIIKAHTVNINTSAVVFDASGQSGQSGGNGGYGGAGGIGGTGGQACCSGGTAYPAGGFGGNGDIGAGGKGGDGGNGGETGFIWIGTTSYTTPGARKLNFGFYAGKGGKKGWGGWSARNTTPNDMSSMNACNGIDCSASGGGGGVPCFNSSNCNPDKAMCFLSTNASYGSLIIGTTNNYNFMTATTPPKIIAKYISKNTIGDGDLEVYVLNPCSTTTTTYKANCVGDCDILFKQIAQDANVNTNYIVTLPNNTNTTCSSTPLLPLTINYIDATNGDIPLLDYYHADVNTPATLTDVSGGSEHLGTFTSCFSSQGPGDGTEYTYTSYHPVPLQATPGNDGDGGTPPPPPPPSGTGNSNDHVIIDDGNSWFTSGIVGHNLTNAFSALAYPNPANKDLNIELQSDMNIMAIVLVKDLNGKELIATKQKLQVGKNKFNLDVSKLNAGFYFVTINANNKQSVLKITIQ